jgi:hypothetical protein
MIIENDLTAIPGCLNAETDTQTVIFIGWIMGHPIIKSMQSCYDICIDRLQFTSMRKQYPS